MEGYLTSDERSHSMDTEVIWSRERFPILYEGSSPKAVMVDINTFAQIELILDNLLNGEVEAEDAILAASTELKQLVTRAQKEQPSSDWKQALYDL
jgi:hypothetical protein